jgi:hypothetical protein
MFKLCCMIVLMVAIAIQGDDFSDYENELDGIFPPSTNGVLSDFELFEQISGKPGLADIPITTPEPSVEEIIPEQDIATKSKL